MSDNTGPKRALDEIEGIFPTPTGTFVSLYAPEGTEALMDVLDQNVGAWGSAAEGMIGVDIKLLFNEQAKTMRTLEREIWGNLEMLKAWRIMKPILEAANKDGLNVLVLMWEQ